MCADPSNSLGVAADSFSGLRLLLFLLSFFTSAFLFAEEDVTIRGFYPSDGLAYETVRDIKRTPDGAMWFATWGGGISRFDGTKWDSFTKADGLPIDDVRTLCVDSLHRLWAGTSRGIAYFDKNRWIPVSVPIEDLPAPALFCFEEISPGQLWMGTACGRIIEYRFSSTEMSTDGKTVAPSSQREKWSIVLDQDVSHANGVRDILRLKSGEILAAVSQIGIVRWEEGHWKILQSDKDARSLVEMKDGLIWASGERALNHFNGQEWIQFTNIIEEPTCVAATANGILCVGTHMGFYFWQKDAQQKLKFSNIVPYPYIECISSFDDGTIWVGTRYGVYRITAPSWMLYKETEDQVPLNGILFYADPQTPPYLIDGKKRLVRFDGDRWKPTLQFGRDNPPFDSMSTPWEGNAWALYANKAAQFRLDPPAILREISIPQGLVGMQIFQTRKGIVYLYGQSGVFILDGDEWRPGRNDPFYKQKSVRVFSEGLDGTIWVGFDDSIEYWKGDRVKSFEKQTLFQDQMPLRLIFQSSDGLMWFGSYSSGIYSYDGNKFWGYNTAEGLMSDRLTSLYEASDKSLWLGSEMMGVSAFRDGRWISYTCEDGLKNKRVTAIGEYPKGVIWAAVENVGVYCYRYIPHCPETRLEKYPSKVAPDDRGVFHFTGLDAWKETDAEDLVYSWRIFPAGGDSQKHLWTPFLKERVVVSPLLKQGRYIFQVRAADKDFNVDPTPAEALFEVLPNFWQRVDVWIILAICLSLTIAAGWIGWLKQVALILSEKKYRELVESIHEIIYSTDSQGIITYISPGAEKASEFIPGEIVGRLFLEFIHPDDRTRMMGNFQKIMQGEIRAGEYRLIGRSGQSVWMRTSSHPTYANGKIVGLSGVATNITERKLAEEALQKAYDDLEKRVQERTADLMRANEALREEIAERQRMEAALKSSEEQFRQAQKMEAIGQLAGGVAHDFNNLLHVILGYTQMAMIGLSSDERRYQYLDKARIAADRSAELTRQLLTFSRRQALNPKYIDLNQLVRQFVTLLDRIIGEDVDVVLNLDENLTTVYADPGILDQALMNLCVNARDAMPSGGRLTISTLNIVLSEDFCEEHPWARPGRFAYLAVSDTGVGMPPDILERIFEPFFTTKEQGKGTGLGLSTVYGGIKQHNGLLDVSSEPGQGTVFSIYLPSENKPISERTEETPIEISGGTETILLAEDEKMVRELATQVLQENGYTVLLAKDGEEAQSIFDENASSIDLILLDMIMPRKSGREVYTHIKNSGSKTPVLFSSGYSADMIPQQDGEEDNLPLIPKPYTPAQLLQRVRELLDRA